MGFDFEKFIKEKVSEALEGCFLDANVFGTGYLKVNFINNDIDIKHIPFDMVEDELENFKEFKKLIKNN